MVKSIFYPVDKLGKFSAINCCMEVKYMIAHTYFQQMHTILIREEKRLEAYKCTHQTVQDFPNTMV